MNALDVQESAAKPRNRRAWLLGAGVLAIVGVAAACWWGYQNWVWLLNPEVKGQIVDFTQQELGVEQAEVGDWKQGVECIVAEVTVSGGETYRVALVSQNPEPKPYQPMWISQIYTLDDFVASSDAGCGIIHTPAWVFDKEGGRVIG